jgi:hypothetical protein
MANTLNITANINGSINGLNISETSNGAFTPVGSTAFAQSILVPTGSYTLIVTGSNFGTASIFYGENTSTSGSISLALSASGVVNDLGNIPSVGSSTNGIGSIINWNGPFTALYAQAYTTASYGVFVVTSA